MATDVSTGKTRGGSHWSAGTDVHLLSLMHRKQAKLYRDEQLAIEARLKRERERNPEYEMTERDERKLTHVNTFLSRATQSILDLNAARDKLQASVPTDTLVVQLRHEFASAARSFTEDELTILASNLPPKAWAVLDRYRAEKLAARAAIEAARLLGPGVT